MSLYIYLIASPMTFKHKVINKSIQIFFLYYLKIIITYIYIQIFDNFKFILYWAFNSGPYRCFKGVFWWINTLIILSTQMNNKIQLSFVTFQQFDNDYSLWDLGTLIKSTWNLKKSLFVKFLHTKELQRLSTSTGICVSQIKLPIEFETIKKNHWKLEDILLIDFVHIEHSTTRSIFSITTCNP